MNRKTIGTHRKNGRGRKAFWITAVLAGLVVAWFAWDGRPARAHGMRGHAGFDRQGSAEEVAERLDRMLDHLDATGPQKEQVAAIIADLVRELEALHGEKQALFVEISKAMTSEQPDREALARARSKTVNLATRAVEQTFDALAELSLVLTPEQRAEIVEHWTERRE